MLRTGSACLRFAPFLAFTALRRLLPSRISATVPLRAFRFSASHLSFTCLYLCVVLPTHVLYAFSAARAQHACIAAPAWFGCCTSLFLDRALCCGIFTLPFLLYLRTPFGYFRWVHCCAPLPRLMLRAARAPATHARGYHAAPIRHGIIPIRSSRTYGHCSWISLPATPSYNINALPALCRVLTTLHYLLTCCTATRVRYRFAYRTRSPHRRARAAYRAAAATRLYAAVTGLQRSLLGLNI